MKAKEREQQKDSEKNEEQPNAENFQKQSTNTKTEEEKQSTETKSDGEKENQTKSEEKKEEIETKPPETIEIDGKEVPIDELKNGYLRQSDYTKKTQEVTRQRKEAEEAIRFYEQLKSNPYFAKQVAEQTKTQLPPNLDPATAKIMELENKIYDMMLEKEISELTNKYDDFEVKDVLSVAHEKNITNLEDAYLLAKSRKTSDKKEEKVDVSKLKDEIRQELLKELESEKNTKSIISSSDNGAPKDDGLPKLSKQELKIATHMNMTPEEYAKWRDVKKR